MSDDFIYKKIKENSNSWGIEVLNGGKQFIAKGKPYPPKDHDHPNDYHFTWESGRTLNEYQMLLITEGSGLFQNEHQETPIAFKAPFFVLIFPEIWHRYKPHSNSDWTEYWIGFKGHIPDALNQNGQIVSTKPIIPVNGCSKLLPHFQKIIHLLKKGQNDQMNVVLHQILVDLCNPQTNKERSNNKYSDLVDQLCLYITDNCHLQIDWEDLSSHFGISYSLLRKVFTQIEGMPPKRYHTTVRLEKVQFLLSHSNMNLTEIAEELGFNSPFHLSSQFKKYFGTSPKEWRQQ